MNISFPQTDYYHIMTDTADICLDRPIAGQPQDGLSESSRKEREAPGSVPTHPSTPCDENGGFLCNAFRRTFSENELEQANHCAAMKALRRQSLSSASSGDFELMAQIEADKRSVASFHLEEDSMLREEEESSDTPKQAMGEEEESSDTPKQAMGEEEESSDTPKQAMGEEEGEGMGGGERDDIESSQEVSEAEWVLVDKPAEDDKSLELSANTKTRRKNLETISFPFQDGCCWPFERIFLCRKYRIKATFSWKENSLEVIMRELTKSPVKVSFSMELHHKGHCKPWVKEIDIDCGASCSFLVPKSDLEYYVDREMLHFKIYYKLT